MADKIVLNITGKTQLDFKKEVAEVLKKGIEDVYQSQAWKDWLTFCASFHNYSYNNRMLVYLQMPYATRVASMKHWNKLGRTVIKGQGAQGIKIYAPTQVPETVLRPKLNADGTPVLDNAGQPVMEQQRRKRTGFVLVSVYDVSQTEGKPLPTLMDELSGEYENRSKVLRALQAITGVPISFGDDFPEGTKGYFFQDFDNPDKKEIRIKIGMSDEQTIKTAVHEAAHALLHARERGMDKPTNQREFEAESIAFVVCNHMGIDTSEYSFPYLGVWKPEDGAMMEEILSTVVATSDYLIEKLETYSKAVDLSNYENKALIQEYLQQSEYLNAIDGEFLTKPFEEKIEILNANISTLEKMPQIAVEICFSEEGQVFQPGQLFALEEVDSVFRSVDQASYDYYQQSPYPGAYDKVMFKVYFQDKSPHPETGEIYAHHIRERYDFGDLTHESLSHYLMSHEGYAKRLREYMPDEERDRQRGSR